MVKRAVRVNGQFFLYTEKQMGNRWKTNAFGMIFGGEHYDPIDFWND